MNAIERAWRDGGLLAELLRPLGVLHRGLGALRHRAYDAGRLPVVASPLPVVVVGNLTVGGTGKTPLTARLVEEFRMRGWRPGIVSRGYGGRRHEEPRHVRAEDRSADVGDEPLMLHRSSGAPVCVCVHRARAVEALARDTDCDLVLSDDGLQHRAMARDVEIVVVDGRRGFGNGRLLPAGPLREPASRLYSVDLVAVRTDAPLPDAPLTDPSLTDVSLTDPTLTDASLTDASLTDPSLPDPSPSLADVPIAGRLEQARLPPSFRFVMIDPTVSAWPDGESCSLASFVAQDAQGVQGVQGVHGAQDVQGVQGAQGLHGVQDGCAVHAVAGIAHPERFFELLEQYGLEVERHPLPDHHAIEAGDLDFGDSRPVFLTVKDGVRLAGVSPLPAELYVVSVDVGLGEGAARWLDRLSERLHERAGRIRP